MLVFFFFRSSSGLEHQWAFDFNFIPSLLVLALKVAVSSSFSCINLGNSESLIKINVVRIKDRFLENMNGRAFNSHLVSTVPQDRISSVYTQENPVISLFKQVVVQEQCEDCSSVAVGMRGLLMFYCPACGHLLCLLTMVGLKTFLGDYPPTPFHVKEAYFSLCHKMLLVAFSCRTAVFPLPVGRSQQGSGP